MKTLRCFFAIDLPGGMRKEIIALTSMLKKQLGHLPVRFVKPENVHISLHFLGDVQPTDLEKLNKLAEEKGNQVQGFRIRIGGLGVFPNFFTPRILWIGVKSHTGSESQGLIELNHLLRKPIQDLGYSTERRDFQPHLTLGRVREQSNPEELRQIGEVVKSMQLKAFGDIEVKEFSLFQSELRSEGPIYTKIHTILLKTNPY